MKLELGYNLETWSCSHLHWKFCNRMIKVAIVTGAATGLGRALSIKLVQLGVLVVCADIQDCQELVNSLNGKAVYCHCNVLVESDLIKLFQAAIKSFGTIDVLSFY
jgi:NAD(P)-dependent dehydrogenase (short-subunit alcohol dehydrogenase family)